MSSLETAVTWVSVYSKLHVTLWVIRTTWLWKPQIRADVPPSSLIRFVKSFGFNGFRKMQKVFQQGLVKSSSDRDHWQRPQSFSSFCGCLSGSKGDRSFWISGFGFECFDVSIPFADCGVGKAVRTLNRTHLNRFTCFERFLCGRRN